MKLALMHPAWISCLLNVRKDYGVTKFNSWVCAALRLNVEHLHLEITLKESKTLFDSLSGCKTLEILMLGVKVSLSSVPDIVLACPISGSCNFAV